MSSTRLAGGDVDHTEADEQQLTGIAAGAAASVDLHDVTAVAVTGVAHRDPEARPCAGSDHHGVVDRERRVRQAEAVGEGGVDAESVEEALAVEAVVGDGRGVAVEEGQVLLRRRDRERQAPRRVVATAQHVGQRVPALHPGVPHEQRGRHEIAPRLGDDRAGRDDRDDRPRVRPRHRLDDLLVDRAQSQRGAIAAHAAGHDRAGLVALPAGVVLAIAEEVEARRHGREQRQELGAHHRVLADVLALVGGGEPGDDDGHVRPSRPRRLPSGRRR